MLRMRHVRLVVLYGLHCLMVQLTLKLHLWMRLVVMVMVIDTRWGSRIGYGGHGRCLR